MALKTNIDGDYLHAIEPNKLIELLNQLPKDVFLVVNMVDNFTIHAEDNSYIGYVDLGSEEIVLFEK